MGPPTCGDTGNNALDQLLPISYDNTGNRTSLIDLAGLHSYTYDDTYQLTIASCPDTSAELYAYDPAGNRSNTAADPDNDLAEDGDYPVRLTPISKAFAQSSGNISARLFAFFSGSQRGANTFE